MTDPSSPQNDALSQRILWSMGGLLLLVALIVASLHARQSEESRTVIGRCKAQMALTDLRFATCVEREYAKKLRTN